MRALARRHGRAPRRARRPRRSRALAAYAWPGNVRELRNAIERAVVLGRGEERRPAICPSGYAPSAAAPARPAGSPDAAELADVERRTIEAALGEGNRTHAARKLGISRRALIYKLHKYGLID